MRKLTFLLGLILISSCVETKKGERKNGIISNFVGITDNEDKGVKEILNFYGGQCKYAKGVSTSSKDGNNKYFELEMSDSEVIQNMSKYAQMPASNVAYLFYKNLEEEKTKYSEIHTVIIFNDGEKITYKYPTNELEQVIKRMDVANKVVSILKDKEFENLALIINEKLFKFDKRKFIENLEKVDPQFGNVLEFQPLGFRINEKDNGELLLHISGVILRDIQNNEFSIDLDLNSDKEEVYLIQYQL